MLDTIVSVFLAAAFLYVVLLMTNPRGAWDCPISRWLARWVGGSKPPAVGSGQN